MAKLNVSELLNSLSNKTDDNSKKLFETLSYLNEILKEAGSGKSEKASKMAKDTIAYISKMPIIKVNREQFLRSTFRNYSDAMLEKIISEGPQSVFSLDFIKRRAAELTRSTANKTSFVSFVSSIPSNPATSTIAGLFDISQFYAYALNLAQKIAYLYGEEDLFSDFQDTGTLPEEVENRILGYLASMMGISGASDLIIATSKKFSEKVVKDIGVMGLRKQFWYMPSKNILKQFGVKLTRQSIQYIVSNSLLVIGAAVSSGITYLMFKPMGYKLSDTLYDLSSGNYEDIVEFKEKDFVYDSEENEN